MRITVLGHQQENGDYNIIIEVYFFIDLSVGPWDIWMPFVKIQFQSLFYWSSDDIALS